jgi:hypothetical protein
MLPDRPPAVKAAPRTNNGSSLFIWKALSEAGMRRLWRVLVVLVAAGCAGKEPPLTQFDHVSKNDFTFEARADLEYPEDDPKAEATRMDWLNKALADRHLCPNGYTITDRTKVAAPEQALGQTHNIAYHGVCK